MAATDAPLVTSHWCTTISPPASFTCWTVSSTLSGLRSTAKILGAFLGEAHGGGAPVAPAGTDTTGAGDDGDLVLQTPAHSSSPYALAAGAKR